MKFVHTNIVAKNVEELANFYINVFDCKQEKQLSQLSGDWLEQGTNVKNAQITQIDLKLPGYENDGPVLEIFQYSEILNSENNSLANTQGLRHLAFKVDNVQNIIDLSNSHGGRIVGQLVRKEFKKGVLEFAYITDPEGNIIEIQSWADKI